MCIASKRDFSLHAKSHRRAVSKHQKKITTKIIIDKKVLANAAPLNHLYLKKYLQIRRIFIYLCLRCSKEKLIKEKLLIV